MKHWPTNGVEAPVHFFTATYYSPKMGEPRLVLYENYFSYALKFPSRSDIGPRAKTRESDGPQQRTLIELKNVGEGRVAPSEASAHRPPALCDQRNTVLCSMGTT